MLGKTLGHYQITSLLGKGGMGEVYRARDTLLASRSAICSWDYRRWSFKRTTEESAPDRTGKMSGGVSTQ